MTDVIILAAGLGTRMKSQRAKVLHELAGRPLIAHVIQAAMGLEPATLLTVVGHQGDLVEKVVRDEVQREDSSHETGQPEGRTRVVFPRQTEQRGTGHAVMAAQDFLREGKDPVVILPGDAPMVSTETLANLVANHQRDQNAATLLTVALQDPTGYGRILRDDVGAYLGSVEEKDASPAERALKEVCVSIYCFERDALLSALGGLNTDNAQGEYYLTDVPRIIQRKGMRVGLLKHNDPYELMGINTRVELAAMEKRVREKKLNQLMLAGVTMIDPATTYVHPEVEIAPDTILHPQVIIEGRSRIGSGCVIHSWSRLRDVTLDDNVTIKNSCVIENCKIASGASIGPFARLRMDAEIGEGAVIGNFVEIKKSQIGRGTKAQHLAYLGDATVGDSVNIGAGTITCNYDGTRKHQTIIEDGAKIGSDTMLVAPVKVGRGSVTGAGAVVTKDIPPDSLAVGVPAVVKRKKS